MRTSLPAPTVTAPQLPRKVVGLGRKYQHGVRTRVQTALCLPPRSLRPAGRAVAGVFLPRWTGISWLRCHHATARSSHHHGCFIPNPEGVVVNLCHYGHAPGHPALANENYARSRVTREAACSVLTSPSVMALSAHHHMSLSPILQRGGKTLPHAIVIGKYRQPREGLVEYQVNQPAGTQELHSISAVVPTATTSEHPCRLLVRNTMSSIPAVCSVVYQTAARTLQCRSAGCSIRLTSVTACCSVKITTAARMNRSVLQYVIVILRS